MDARRDDAPSRPPNRGGAPHPDEVPTLSQSIFNLEKPTGGRSMSAEEFAQHFGHLPTDDEG